MRRLLGLIVIASLSSGCALAPHAGPHGGTVMEDVLCYLDREWPLEPPSGGAHGMGDVGGCDNHFRGAMGVPASPLTLGNPDQAPLLRRQPVVYESGGPPGRFFPAPTKPPFQPHRVAGPAVL